MDSGVENVFFCVIWEKYALYLVQISIIIFRNNARVASSKCTIWHLGQIE